MDAVIDLGQGALEITPELEPVVLIVLEALEFLDEVELELYRYPGGEFKGYVSVCVGATVTSSFGNQPNGSSFFDPLLGCKNEACLSGCHTRLLDVVFRDFSE